MNKIVVKTWLYDSAGNVTQLDEKSFSFVNLPPSVKVAELPPIVVLGQGDLKTEIPAKPAEPTIKLVEKFPDGIVLEQWGRWWRVRREGKCLTTKGALAWWSYFDGYDKIFGGFWFTEAEARERIAAYFAANNTPAIEQDVAGEFGCTRGKWRARIGVEFVHTGEQPFLSDSCFGGYWYGTRDEAQHALNAYLTREEAKKAKPGEPVIDWRRTECVVDERNGNFRVRHVPTGMIWGSWVGWQDPADHSDKHPSASGYFYSRRSEFDSFYTRNDIKPPTTKAKAKKSEISFKTADEAVITVDAKDIETVGTGQFGTYVYATGGVSLRTKESFASVTQRIAEALKPR